MSFNLDDNPPHEAGRARPAAGSCSFPWTGKKRRKFRKVLSSASHKHCLGARGPGGRTTARKNKEVSHNEDAVHRIDQQLAESHDLLAALIFISENVEDHQHELLQHSAISLCHSVLDKIAAANRDVSLLLRIAA
jgi:hypothetical protein